MTEDQEREMIRDSIKSIFIAHRSEMCGLPSAPLYHTLNSRWIYFAEVGSELFGNDAGIYTCDLFHDDQPTPIHLRSKKRFVSVPYSLEMNDTIAYVSNKIEPRRYGQMLKDNFDQLYKEGSNSGTVMCIPTHNYQISCPHRMKSYEEALEYITGHSDVWVTTGREIAEYYLEHYYDDSVRDIEDKLGQKS